MRILQYKDYFHMSSDEFEPGDVIVAKIAMVIGYDKDYAVYVSLDEQIDGETVANEGDKVLDQNKVANGMFSTAAYGRYARR